MSSKNCQTGYWSCTQHHIPWESGFFPGGKAFGRRGGRGGGVKVGHSQLSSFEFKNGRSDTYSPRCTFIVLTGSNFLNYISQ